MNMTKVILFWLFCAILLISVVVIYGQQNENLKQNVSKNPPLHGWTCENNKCHKSIDANATSLGTCKMLCYDSPPLWPKPKQLEIINKNSTLFQKEHIVLTIHSPNEVKSELEEAANTFLESLPKNSTKYHLYEGEVQILKLNIHVKERNIELSTSTKESYTLFCQKLPEAILVNIFASNYFGARHGLETLSQLIWHDTLTNKLRILHDIKITDEPSFNHRGVLIDVSRHFFSIDILKKAVDGMAASKLNVLHLHLSDAASFPLQLPNSKISSNGAYDENSIYTPEDIKHLVQYAKKRGIRTILEIDAPSHVSPEAWPKDEVLCADPDMFRATLNPDNPETLNTLQSVYENLFELGTDPETFHIGDDEVVTECWSNTVSAQKEDNNVYNVWSKFTNAMMERVKIANNNTLPKNIVLWSSPLTDNYIKSLSYQKDLVVQYWFGQFGHILDNGYKIIFSTVGQWYLDCGFGPWKKIDQYGSCDPYTDWKKFYHYRPWKDYPQRLSQVLGGEVCLWSEQVSPDDVETRLWPRTAAFAERVWSDPDIIDIDDVARRIDFHSERLKERGFRVAAIWPQICWLYPERC
ncbi:unnamed protein product [Ceutorhynchus assimilis]|uniref:Beta-hexosaminidase n=1 Tax=Ceutorhynchus assimilis TaxID=467358 RepID=A0A9N9MUF0_9CUCU|nr:unnamed protein product [Ceutorhynchus assimilis]